MKAILITDMPNQCYQCPCFYCDPVHSFCQALHQETKGNTKPDWCPLKALPEIKNLRDYRDKIVGDYKLQIRISDFISGYNSCIDEILGEQK